MARDGFFSCSLPIHSPAHRKETETEKKGKRRQETSVFKEGSLGDQLMHLLKSHWCELIHMVIFSARDPNKCIPPPLGSYVFYHYGRIQYIGKWQLGVGLFPASCSMEIEN